MTPLMLSVQGFGGFAAEQAPWQAPHELNMKGHKMDIDERMESALADLEDLVLEGVPITEALGTAAGPYSIKIEALQARAAPSGNIGEFVDRVLRAKARRDIKATIDKAVNDFVERGIAFNLRQAAITDQLRSALTDALGRAPTEFEISLAKEGRVVAIERRRERILDQMLSAGTGRNPNFV